MTDDEITIDSFEDTPLGEAAIAIGEEVIDDETIAMVERAMLDELLKVEPLNEVCEHGCHVDDEYGFVVMMGCPIHD